MCLEKWYDAISRDCGIDSMWPVCYTTKRNNKCIKNTPNYFTYKIKYHMYNQLYIKKNIYTTLNLYIHPAETLRLLKFLFHRIGRLVPAHNYNRSATHSVLSLIKKRVSISVFKVFYFNLKTKGIFHSTPSPPANYIGESRYAPSNSPLLHTPWEYKATGSPSPLGVPLPIHHPPPHPTP